MSEHLVDLDRYFARTGYTGPRTPTLEALRAIARAHVETIPFENLDVVLGRGVDLALPAVERKLVDHRRGGYCFEHNSLLLAVLTQLGFTATPLGGRVLMRRPRTYTPARTHLFLRVDLDEPWLVDVGFGAASLATALRLATEEPQATPHEARRLVRDGGLLYNQIQYPGDPTWHDMYVSDLAEMPAIDREVGNWFTSTHPSSHFKQQLIAARAFSRGGETGRITLENRELTIRHLDGRAERHTIASPDELLAVLAEQFGLELPPGTRFACPTLTW
ncbi:MAG TPA: arylamine N-acetyltransferase [Kofleriaceae bacterium]|nr:arylamine N-acetyltransferase [Kofleriaceae bacterium]